MDCIICHETIKENSAAALQCGHIFDRQCITLWIQVNSSCPICRKHVPSKNIVRLFNEDTKDKIELLLTEEREKLKQLHKNEIENRNRDLLLAKLRAEEFHRMAQDHLEKNRCVEREYNALIEKHNDQTEEFEALKQHNISILTELEALKEWKRETERTIYDKLLRSPLMELLREQLYVSSTVCLYAAAILCLTSFTYELLSVQRIIWELAVFLGLFYYRY